MLFVFWHVQHFQHDCAFEIGLDLIKGLITLEAWLLCVSRASFLLFLCALVSLVVPAWTWNWTTAAESTAKAAVSPQPSSASPHPRIWALMGTASTGPCRGDLPPPWATRRLRASRPPPAPPGSESSKSRPCDFRPRPEKESDEEVEEAHITTTCPWAQRGRGLYSRQPGLLEKMDEPGSIAGVEVSRPENHQSPCHVCTVDMDTVAAFLIVSNSSSFTAILWERHCIISIWVHQQMSLSGHKVSSWWNEGRRNLSPVFAWDPLILFVLLSAHPAYTEV